MPTDNYLIRSAVILGLVALGGAVIVNGLPAPHHGLGWGGLIWLVAVVYGALTGSKRYL